MHDGIQSPINPFSPLFPPIYGEQGGEYYHYPPRGYKYTIPRVGCNKYNHIDNREGVLEVRDNQWLVQAFERCISEFPTGRGHRNCRLLPRAACLAVKLGVDESTYVERIREVAPDMSAYDIHRAFRTATHKVKPYGAAGGSFSQWRQHSRSDRQQSCTQKRFQHHVQNTIAAGGDVRTFEELMRLSPEPVADMLPEEQAWHQLRRLFPDDNAMVYIFRNDPPMPGVLGRSVRSVRDWLDESHGQSPVSFGELVVPNPFSGELGRTTEGRPSYVAQSCLASFQHLILEFDEMPLAEQCSFWAGFIRKSKIPLLTLVYSGGKSIHGCINIGAVDVDQWNRKRDQIEVLFAADENHSFRADTQAMRPRTGTRLAGATRIGNGNLQRLLWACTLGQAKQASQIAASGINSTVPPWGNSK